MKRYISIDMESMRENNLSLEEWVLLENIYFLSNNEYRACYASKESLREYIGVSNGQIYKILKDLEEKGFLVKNSFGHLQITQKYLNMVCTHSPKIGDTLQNIQSNPPKNGEDTLQKMETKRDNTREILREKEKESKDSLKKAHLFNFTLSKKTTYNNLSKEYKEKLFAKCLLADGDAKRFDSFVEQLEAKGYQYVNFYKAYLAWDRDRNYQNYEKEPEPSLGENWFLVRLGGDKVVAINEVTLETKHGEIKRNTPQPYQEKTQKNTTHQRDVSSLLGGTYAKI